MPVYEFECLECGKITEKVFKIDDCPQRIECECGKTASKIISRSRIQCDSIYDVSWLPSALLTLQPDGERPIETRGEYNRYLKKKGIIASG